ncbi:MAG: FKBP-type peptidyl-prolyl cis-trans isomerase [Muribaculaceae bacterium]|nr:FKBP-type peptidyl-prolyl cis-trans isomerase [Muribaculaceae bacterium]
MKKLFFIFPLISLLLSSCLGDDKETDYTEWEQKNTTFVTDQEALRTPAGKLLFTRLTPDWAPQAFCLVKWENDRTLTADNLRPLSNSLVNLKYDVDDIDGNRISDSYSSTTYGDSIYQCRPNQNIIGFWNCVTNMQVGDSVTCVIPYVAGYGSTGNGNIKPYSTLVYHIKLVSIPAYQLPL